ncbi:RND transporter [Salinisphaera orenii MK-B5]|uniref:RND transporter n=1 Tax=Salinisphaera orenii MK-B5 TaxID=856730 RepID=A0A423PU73_9GAMM|nr:efflux transporter outer membrane subunit [Salinisphaera orenii]ROO29082.1 RND transporter [Salinisphaera orenii MK-B5]
MKHYVLTIVMSLLLAACAVGPDYAPPATPPAELQAVEQGEFVATSPEAAWWSQFDDAELDSLVTRALGANLDLQVALSRVRTARAVFTGEKYDYAPHVPLGASYTRSDRQQLGLGDRPIDTEQYSLGFDASWEIDLFGHVRRSVEAAGADLGAEQAALRAAEVTVAAEVARNYFELRGAQRRIAVARANLENAGQTLDQTSVRYEIGTISQVDVYRSRAQFKAIEAAIPPLQASERRAAFRLAVLLGQRPGALDDELRPARIATYAKALPIGDTSDLLRRRPDVRAAERRLAAATARVGVATADLFPRVSVTGFVGFISGDSADLFNFSADGARAWSVTPTVSWAAFDFGSLRARLKAREAQAEGALADYQKAVLIALEDTENSLTAYAKQQSRLYSLVEQAQAAGHAADLAAVQYRTGSLDFLDLLDAQRERLAADDAVAAAQTAVNVSVAGIYKALGGVGQPENTYVMSR